MHTRLFMKKNLQLQNLFLTLQFWIIETVNDQLNIQGIAAFGTCLLIFLLGYLLARATRSRSRTKRFVSSIGGTLLTRSHLSTRPCSSID